MSGIEAILEKHPLVAFSVYTHIQVEVLKDLGATIRASLDTTMSEGHVQGPGFNKLYGEFWLWVIGVYEVVRTMDQATGSFSGRAGADIHAFKRRVAKLRMPFAKQEYSGSTQGGLGQKHPSLEKTRVLMTSHTRFAARRSR